MLGRATLAPFTGRGQGEGPGSVSRKPIASTNSARGGALWHVPQAPHPNPLPASGEREKGAPFPSLRGGEADAAIQRPRVTPGLLRLRLARTMEGANPSPTRGRTQPREARSDEGCWGLMARSIELDE